MESSKTREEEGRENNEKEEKRAWRTSDLPAFKFLLHYLVAIRASKAAKHQRKKEGQYLGEESNNLKKGRKVPTWSKNLISTRPTNALAFTYIENFPVRCSSMSPSILCILLVYMGCREAFTGSAESCVLVDSTLISEMQSQIYFMNTDVLGIRRSHIEN